ncbi:MAG: hypothetical protein Fur0021_26430 [Candidatus Promineifilaceae bacterium]
MTKSRRSEPSVLAALEKLYEKYRKKVKPLFPYDARTNTIRLPPDIKAELQRLVLDGDKVQAVKRVAELTGAGLRVSKDYVDNLVKSKT